LQRQRKFGKISPTEYWDLVLTNFTWLSRT